MDPQSYEIAFYAITIISGLICILGIIGNICLICVYRKKNAKLRFNKLMITLASFDLTFLLLTPIFWVLDLSGVISPIWLKVTFFLIQSALSGSVYSTMAIAIERYFAVCKGKEIEKSFKWTFLAILISSIMLSIPNLLFSLLLHTLLHELIKNVFTFITIGLIPSVSLITLNKLIFGSLEKMLRETFLEENQENEKREKRMAKTKFRARLTLGITIMFVISQLLFWIPIFIRYPDDDFSDLQILTTLIGLLILILNSSLNFYVYLFLAKREQQQSKNTNIEMKNFSLPTTKETGV